MTDETDVVEVVITGPAEFMTGYCQQLVKDRLIACAQVTEVESTYRWQGQVESDPESRASLHTVQDNVNAIIERTRSAHPYDVPCILALPIHDGNVDYLEWVRASVEAGTARSAD